MLLAQTVRNVVHISDILEEVCASKSNISELKSLQRKVPVKRTRG